jgi:hypothetical protein
MSGHFTYVIGSGHYHVKIGHSRYPRMRLGDLQIGSSVGLWLCHTWRADQPSAVALESTLHKAFAWCALEGEWFDTLASPVIAVGDLIRAGRDQDADRLLAIVQRMREIPKEEGKLRQAWRWVPGKERRRVELEAAAARKALDAESAALQLEAYDLGLWPEGATSERALPDHLNWLRQRAA